MNGFTPKTFPLNAPLNAGTSPDALGEPTITFAQNVDYGREGAVRGRPGFTRVTGFSRRTLDGTDLPQDVTIANLAATGYTALGMHNLKDALGERPGVMARGRLFSYDGDRWTDRLGVTTMRHDKLATLRSGLTPTWLAPTTVPACAPDFGPDNSSTFRVVGLDAQGRPESRGLAVNPIGTGNGARCGTVTAMVHVPVGTNNLVLVTRTNGGNVYTETILKADARNPTGFGDAPVICCDFNETAFYIVYATTTLHTFNVLKVSTAGVVAYTQSYLYGAGVLRGLWITNTTVATNRLVVIATDSATAGAMTYVITSSTGVGAGIDLNVMGASAMANSGQCVVGAAQNGEVHWACLQDTGGFVAGRRSLTAATATFWSGASGVAGGTWAGGTTPNPASGAVHITLQHQPIVVSGRVLLGLNCFLPSVGSGPQANGFEACNWYVFDITDRHTNAAGGLTGDLRDPVMVAMGRGESCAAFGPHAATVNSNGLGYRFVSLDWANLALSNLTSTNAYYFGDTAAVIVNEVVMEDHASAPHKESTVFAGCVPRQIARGNCIPVGYPWQGGPSITIARVVGGGTLAAGSYTAVACWAYIDEAGQIHRSAPSLPVTLSGFALNDRLLVTATQPHFNERDDGRVFTEFYVTDVNPTGNAVHYFVARALFDRTLATASSGNIAAIDKTQQLLYTDGNVLPIRQVNGDGGVAVVGQRCWLSDGHALFASRLGPTGVLEAPSWNTDDPLTLEIPGTAGRVRALAKLDDKLVIGCDGGLWITGGAGPDDTGAGPGFAEPEQVANIGVLSPRAMVSTPRGVFFYAANSAQDGQPQTGGLWLLDRSLSCVQISHPLLDLLTGTPATVVLTYHPEREQLFVMCTDSFTVTIVLDTRTNHWASWNPAAGCGDAWTALCSSKGILWGCGTEPMKFTMSGGETVGQDTGSSTQAFSMTLSIDDIYPSGDPGGWCRVRSLKVIGALDDANAILSVDVTLDQAANFSASIAAPVATGPSGGASWPGALYRPEVFFPQQKCSKLSVTLDSSNGTAIWTALELLVKPSIRAKTNRRVQGV